MQVKRFLGHKFKWVYVLKLSAVFASGLKALSSSLPLYFRYSLGFFLSDFNFCRQQAFPFLKLVQEIHAFPSIVIWKQPCVINYWAILSTLYVFKQPIIYLRGFRKYPFDILVNSRIRNLRDDTDSYMPLNVLVKNSPDAKQY